MRNVNKNKYEGKKYIFKRNSIKKTNDKYKQTYNYILLEILKYKKYINEFNKNIKHDKNNLNKLTISVIERTGQDLNIDNTKVYNYKKYNRLLKKAIKKELKNPKNSNSKIIEIYKQIENKNYKNLRQTAIKKTNIFLEALYLYTICED